MSGGSRSPKDERKRYTSNTVFTAFDRALIAAAQESKLVTFELVHDEDGFTGNVCTVDKYFIEVFVPAKDGQSGRKFWINKSLIAKAQVA